MAAPRRYVYFLALTIAVTAALAASLNLVVDPYGLFQLVSRPGFNTVKPRLTHWQTEIKMTRVLDRKANALIIGNSRAEIGFDPAHPVWHQSALDAYNLAVPGAGIQNSADQIRQLARQLKPRVVLLGLDFLDFLVDPATEEAAAPADSPFGGWDKLRLIFKSLFSIQASADSLRTLTIQNDEFPESTTEGGFNPLLDYELIARKEGYYTMFRQRAEENARRLAHMPKALFFTNTRSSPEWEALTTILTETLGNGGAVEIVIYPYHAQILAMFEHYELWNLFETWKKRVVEVSQAAQSGHNGRIDVWDFSGFSELQCEPIPRPGDKKSRVQWYWEAGHFKKELGDMVVARIFSEGRSPEQESSQVFGMKLTPTDLAINSARILSERENCLANNPEIFSEVAQFVTTARSPY